MKRLIKKDSYWQGGFQAMASPCEVLVDYSNPKLAKKIVKIAEEEAKRIEQKFSRYQKNNIVHRINSSHGETVKVDEETARLLDYADQCFELSGGLFDVTSGVLREAWRFDGSDNVPNEDVVSSVMDRVGWEKVTWNPPYLTLRNGMQIDFGGIGKEYAVDRAGLLIKQSGGEHVLINFGGDMVANGPRASGIPWEIGLQDPTSDKQSIIASVDLMHGAVATSGDLHRFLLRDGKRYSHILNPKDGWPIENAARQVTVVAPTCIEAGILSTFAILQGKGAESFLEDQEVEFRVIW